MASFKMPRHLGVIDRLVDVFHDIVDESQRAHQKHRAASFLTARYTDDQRLKYLVEEVGEVAKAIQDDAGLREELVQVAHLAVVWAVILDEDAQASS